jgi:hypothetical protein
MISSKDGGETVFASVIVFDAKAQAELMRLTADAVSVQGTAKIGVYGKYGEHRSRLSVVADHVLALRQP